MERIGGKMKLKYLVLSLILFISTICSKSFAATYSQYLTAVFGSTLSGQAANILVTVTDSGGTVRIASTNNPGVSAFAEETDVNGNPGCGTYTAIATFNTTWAYPLKVKYVITGQVYVVAISILGSDISASVTNGYTSTLATNIGTTNTALSGVTFPTNFGTTSIDSSGRVLLQPTETFSTTGSVGSVTGSVGSVTGSVNSVVGAVGSVTGNIGGISGVTLPATIPSLSQIVAGLPSDSSITTDTETGLTTQGYTSARAPYLSIINTAIPNIAPGSSGGLLTFGTGSGQISGDAFARLGMPSGSSIDADILTRLPTSGYTTPPTTGAIASAVASATYVVNIAGAVNDTSATTTSFITNLAGTYNGQYNGGLIVFTNGTLSGKAIPVTAYNNSTERVTVAHALPVAPSNSETFIFIPGTYGQ